MVDFYATEFIKGKKMYKQLRLPTRPLLALIEGRTNTNG